MIKDVAIVLRGIIIWLRNEEDFETTRVFWFKDTMVKKWL